MVSVRGGFSLVETVVAAVLLSVAVLSAATGGAAALRALAAAEREHGALTAAAAILDSLTSASATGAGRIIRPPFAIDWMATTDTASLTHFQVTARTAASPHDSILTLFMITSPAPPVGF
jgi:Tfp pilus assembly protein PilV